MDLNEFFEKLNIDPAEAIEFFNDNDWFGIRPNLTNGAVILSDEQITLFTEKLDSYMDAATTSDLLETFTQRFPNTARTLKKFFKAKPLPDDAKFHILDFLLANMKKDISLYNDDEIKELLNIASTDMILSHIDYLMFFLSYNRKKCKTRYYTDYGLKPNEMDNNDAYPFSEYIKILFHLFNEEYIKANDMYKKAAHSKNYSDTWLFLAMHFVSSIRMTDLERLYHPRLPKEPQAVLDEIAAGTFTDLDAREVLYSVIYKLKHLPLTPNKTKRSSNVPNIKLEIPHSCETHIGTLLALVEAHQQVENKPGPMIRRIATYEQINRYMGEEIGTLFFQSNFRCRKANKSFMQALQALANEISDENGVKVKGYMLAALARSHKGGFGKFASTTATYLRDAAFTGMTAEFAALELYERGAFSNIQSMMLDMTTNGEYKKLDVSSQTQLIKKLGMSNREIEDTVAVFNASRKRAWTAIFQAVTDEIPIIEALHRIGSGAAYSKQSDCLCMMSAFHRSCPYSHEQCIGCEFEIDTKATLFHLAMEFERVSALYQKTTDPLEQNKYELLIKTIIVPKLEEMLVQIKEMYGDSVYEDYCRMVEEYVK